MSFDLPAQELQKVTRARGMTAEVWLGMPHLDSNGLSLNWLLRECCHRHWLSISDWLETVPSGLTDMCGDRMMASVVAVTVRGRLERFQEDDLATIEMLTAPRRETGWLSTWLIRSKSGGVCQIELVTSYAKRTGPSNRDLRAAELPHELLPYFDGKKSQRAQVLKSQGRSERAAAPAAGAPLLAMLVREHAHYNAVGLMYFANFVEPFEEVERLAIPGCFGEYALVSRDIHYSGNVDAGDHLDIDCTPLVTSIGPVAEILLTSVARRRSDDRIVAICVSTRQVKPRGASS